MVLEEFDCGCKPDSERLAEPQTEIRCALIIAVQKTRWKRVKGAINVAGLYSKAHLHFGLFSSGSRARSQIMSRCGQSNSLAMAW